jgi:hypothetical protein
MLQIPLPGVPTVGVFCISMVQGGQERVFQFHGCPAKYKAHYSLSLFRPLLIGNSSMLGHLILKMNSGYNGVSRELKKFAK